MLTLNLDVLVLVLLNGTDWGWSSFMSAAIDGCTGWFIVFPSLLTDKLTEGTH